MSLKPKMKEVRGIKKQMKTRIADLAAQIQTIRDGIAQQIQDLPQNHRISPVGQSGKAFTIKACDFGTRDWSASYHDFKAQYRKLAQLVQKGSPETIISRLNHALDCERIDGINLHPDVIKHVRGLLT